MSREPKQTTSRTTTEYPSNRPLWVVLAILSILLVISLVVLSIQFYGYTRLDDRTIQLTSSMDETLEVFSAEYKNDAGAVTVRGQNGEKVLAPGTEMEYTLRFTNADKVALDYAFRPQATFTSMHKLPLQVRFLDSKGNYLIGSETTWVDIDQIDDVSCEGTLAKGETAEYVFQWQWPFESGNDELDTQLGSLSSNEDVGIDLTFGIHSTVNTSTSANGGLLRSPTGRLTIFAVIFLVLAVAVVAVLISILVRRLTRRKKPPVAPAVVKPEAPKPMPQAATVKLTTSGSGKMAFVNIDTLDQAFSAGERITLALVKERGLLPKSAKRMKILARTDSVLEKAFIVETQGISRQAHDLILRAGGQVILSNADAGEDNH